MTKIIFLTGASGSGKTSVADHIHNNYQKELITLSADDNGVPSPEEMVRLYGGGEGFQKHQLNYWLDFITTKYPNEHIVLLEGSFQVRLIESSCKELKIDSFSILLFDCTDDVRRQRLIERGQPELATEDMMNYARNMKDQAVKSGITTIINTSALTIDQSCIALLRHLRYSPGTQTF